MSRIIVRRFQLDEVNEEKFARHGIRSKQVSQVLENPFVVVGNRKGRRGTALIIGRDNGGACLTIPAEATGDPHVWRPITAWRCKDYERLQLEQAGF